MKAPGLVSHDDTAWVSCNDLMLPAMARSVNSGSMVRARRVRRTRPTIRGSAERTCHGDVGTPRRAVQLVAVSCRVSCRRLLLPALFVLGAVSPSLLAGCRSGHKPPVLQPGEPAVPRGRTATLRVQTRHNGAAHVVTFDLEEYVRLTVGAEIVVSTRDAAWAQRIYEVQAIVARTYALANIGRHAEEGFDLCSTTHCQLLPDRAHPTRSDDVIAAAVETTRGLVIAHDGRPIRALFHAHCGGHTSDADQIWPGPAVPYLRGVRDPFCLRERPARWTFRLSSARLTRDLDGSPRTRVDGRIDGFQVVERDPAGRVRMVALTGRRNGLVRGEELRSVVMQAEGPTSLRSPRYTVRRDGDTFVFDGQGFGHGAGLCQTGMMGRIKAGHTPNDVLTYYFHGSRIVRLDRLTS
ncbi:MAG: SpoIID/LytB domain-containing protein [Luteitalea sp.]|nr:SpoIID/LytB domain-containing protein [Luteitalea sp.]